MEVIHQNLLAINKGLFSPIKITNANPMTSISLSIFNTFDKLHYYNEMFNYKEEKIQCEVEQKTELYQHQFPDISSLSITFSFLHTQCCLSKPPSTLTESFWSFFYVPLLNNKPVCWVFKHTIGMWAGESFSFALLWHSSSASAIKKYMKTGWLAVASAATLSIWRASHSSYRSSFLSYLFLANCLMTLRRDTRDWSQRGWMKVTGTERRCSARQREGERTTESWHETGSTVNLHLLKYKQGFFSVAPDEVVAWQMHHLCKYDQTLIPCVIYYH